VSNIDSVGAVSLFDAKRGDRLPAAAVDMRTRINRWICVCIRTGPCGCVYMASTSSIATTNVLFASAE
jgi:hypothetical protein